MWRFKVIIYFTAVCATADPVTEGYDDSTAYDLTAKVTPTVYQPPTPSLLLLSSWSDVFPSEKVELSCDISSSSDWTFIWYRDGTQVQGPDLNFEGSLLTITASPDNAGSYTCKCHHITKGVDTALSNSIVLNVEGNKPKPTMVLTSGFDKVFPGESATFTCMVNVIPGWNYLWYHNGVEIQGSHDTTYTIDAIDHRNSGAYYCKAKRGKGPFFTEQSDPTTLLVSNPSKPTLKLLTPLWLDVFKSESVEMRCNVDSDDWRSIWYRDGIKIQEGDSTLKIPSVSQTDKGVYTCQAQHKTRSVISESSDPLKVTVYDNKPKPTVNKNPPFNPMYVGEKMTFTCEVAIASGWKYVWYKDGKVLPDTAKIISIHLSRSDGGKYSCKAIRGGITTELSDEMTQDVLEIPIPTLALKTQWSDVFPTENVELTCQTQSGSGWTYTWYRGDQEIQKDNTVSFDLVGGTLSISSASASHKGQYRCKGHLSGRSVSSAFSTGLALKVYDKKPSVSLTQDPDYNVMFPGEAVSFSCGINVSSGWEYQWFNGIQLTETSNKYTISSVVKTNSGSYTCQAKRGKSQVFVASPSPAVHLEIKETKPKPSVSQQPDDHKVYNGESVSFTCTLGISSGWEYSWYKDGKPLIDNNKNFNISDVTSLNNGIYTCMASRNKKNFITEQSDGRILTILDIPVPLLKQGSRWLDVFPDESITLTCGMAAVRTDWTYKWYRDSKEIQADDAVSFGEDGSTLYISSVSISHRGQYSCSGKLKIRPVQSPPSRVVTLIVYGTKPSAILMQTPGYNLMHSGDKVSFSCHMNVSSGWEYILHKDKAKIELPESGNSYVIDSVVTTNTGSYQCQAKRRSDKDFLTGLSPASRLKVVERPKAAIVLLTGWSEVFSTDSLILKCEVQESQDVWNYTWSKAGKHVSQSSEKYVVTPQNNAEQGSYSCKGVRTERPSYSKDSSPFATKNLLLKRRVLLSISGCLFFGMIAVVIGCIVLRVTRKPVKGDDKPEEAELFLTMAQLKNRGDAPCPMVEYITDEALNAPSKEGEEKDPTSSESTPLPIISEEDQAATAESLDTAENNGGLVSFKQ